METEKLKFKIGLSGTVEKQPQYRISVNSLELALGHLTVPPGETEYIEFEADIEEGNNKLEIELVNKGFGDTVLDEQGNIISDLILNIESIEIDDIELGAIKWSGSEYRPQYPARYVSSFYKENNKTHPPEVIKNCVNLGWNGKWTLPFQSPFYIWLLENI